MIDASVKADGHGGGAHADAADSVWAEAADAVLARLRVDPAHGLDRADESERRKRHGSNRLRAHRPRGSSAILIDQFRSLIVALLAVAALVALTFGQWIEAVSILVVIGLNAAIGFVTERRARRSMDALFALATVHTRVMPSAPRARRRARPGSAPTGRAARPAAIRWRWPCSRRPRRRVSSAPHCSMRSRSSPRSPSIRSGV